MTDQHNLSPRQAQVYELLAQGKNRKQIMDELGITPSNVAQCCSAMRKLGYPIPLAERHYEALERQGQQTRLRICQAIAAGAHRPSMVSQHAHISRASVKNHLTDLRAEGLVVGRYASLRLTEKGIALFGTDDFDKYYPHGGPSLEYFERRFAEMETR